MVLAVRTTSRIIGFIVDLVHALFATLKLCSTRSLNLHEGSASFRSIWLSPRYARDDYRYALATIGFYEAQARGADKFEYLRKPMRPQRNVKRVCADCKV